MGARILIADNSAFARKLLKNVLEEAGHDVVAEAENGIYAVEKFKEIQPDLAILEVAMPTYSGLNTLADILEFDPAAKIIMCTTMNQHIVIEDAFKMGAKGYIGKPFRAVETVEEVNRVLAEP